ncbi:MAG: hypothetical protein H6618_04775 [Deltaproteobacteria bacterium]|nr:hypothetical protein [Deltaproteobacteria bacterium]
MLNQALVVSTLFLFIFSGCSFKSRIEKNLKKTDSDYSWSGSGSEPFPGESVPGVKKMNLVYRDYSKLRKEFDMCPYWNENFGWGEFQDVRTYFQRTELYKIVDKIEASKELEKNGYPVIPVYYSSKSKEPFSHILDKYKSYVVKPNHMSASNGVWRVLNGKTGSGEDVDTKKIEKEIFAAMDSPSSSNEWLLNHMTRGFLVQEYVIHDDEYKFQTIWGVVRGGLIMGPGGFHYYHPDGTPIDGSPPLQDPELWEEGIRMAEKIAVNTDGLRVDLLVRKNADGTKDLLVNELELRSALGWPNEKLQFAHFWNEGYMGNCIPGI